MVTPMNYMTSGCTCVAVYMKGRTLYVANSGDSRAVMGVDDGTHNVKEYNMTYMIFVNHVVRCSNASSVTTLLCLSIHSICC